MKISGIPTRCAINDPCVVYTILHGTCLLQSVITPIVKDKNSLVNNQAYFRLLNLSTIEHVFIKIITTLLFYRFESYFQTTPQLCGFQTKQRADLYVLRNYLDFTTSTGQIDTCRAVN